VTGVGSAGEVGGRGHQLVGARSRHGERDVMAGHCAHTGPLGLMGEIHPGREELIEQFRFNLVDRLAMHQGVGAGNAIGGLSA